MENDHSNQALNLKQFEQALGILSREQCAYTTTSRQEKIFKLLNLAIYGLGIVGCLFFLILIGSEIYFVIFEKIDWKSFWNVTLGVFIWGGLILLTVDTHSYFVIRDSGAFHLELRIYSTAAVSK